jgi:hypothetical protein
MRSISMRPVAAARATKGKTRSARLQRARSSSPRAWPLQARHSKSNPGTSEHQRGHASATTWRSSGEAAGGVNTDISEPHALTTKRAGPERAFERDALKVSTRDSAFDSCCERSLANAGPERAEHPERHDCNQRTRTGEALARVGERH